MSTGARRLVVQLLRLEFFAEATSLYGPKRKMPLLQ